MIYRNPRDISFARSIIAEAERRRLESGMSEPLVLALLGSIDEVEMELRRLEGKLSRLRYRIRKEMLNDRVATTRPESEQTDPKTLRRF